jgi:C4-dicarboxylate-specific signal transduction histidine kinase
MTGGEESEGESGNARPEGRSPLVQLLHALNQPLTGLQRSLELALMGPRSVEQHVHSLRDGLELTGRMRVLVEAIRELVDLQEAEAEQMEVIELESLLRGTVEELLPVAEARGVRILLEAGDCPLSIQAGRHRLAVAVFRFLESAVSRAARGSIVQISAKSEGKQAYVSVRWEARKALVQSHASFSPSELGLLIAQAGWERAGGRWHAERTHEAETVTIRLPLLDASVPENANSASGEALAILPNTTGGTACR